MQKRLYRSINNKKIAGVAGGLADYFGIDPVIIRALFVITTFAWGFSLVIYLVLWVIVPEEYVTIKSNYYDEDNTHQDSSLDITEHSSNKKFIFAIILIAVGIIALIDNIIPHWDVFKLWPLALIVVGLYMIFKVKINKNQVEI